MRDRGELINQSPLHLLLRLLANGCKPTVLGALEHPSHISKTPKICPEPILLRHFFSPFIHPSCPILALAIIRNHSDSSTELAR